MKEYILKFTMPDGSKRTLRRLLTPDLIRLAITGIGKTDKNGIRLDEAEPVEISVRHELLKQLAKN